MEVANQEQARLHASSRIWPCTRCTCISSNHFLRHNYIRTNRSSLCPCSLTRTFRYGFLSSPDCLELILRPSRASARCRLLSVDQEQKKDHNKTRGQWPYRLASYGDEPIISDSKLGLKFEIGSKNCNINLQVASNSYLRLLRPPNNLGGCF